MGDDRLLVPAPADVDKTPRTITAMDLLTLRDATNVAVSPRGSYVAFRLRQADLGANDYRTAWYVVGVEIPLRWVGDAGEMLWDHIGQPSFHRSAGPQWSEDEQWIVYRLKKDGQIQLWRSHIADGLQEQLTHNDADVVEFTMTPDLSAVLFATGAPRSTLAAERDRLVDEGVVIDDSVPAWGGWPGPDPSRTAVGKVTKVWALDLESRSERPASAPEQQVYTRLTVGPEIGERPYPRLATVSPDGARIAFAAPTGPGVDGASVEAYAIYVKELPDGDLIELHREPRVASLAWSLSGTVLYFAHHHGPDEPEGSSVSAVSVPEGKVRQLFTTDRTLSQVTVASESDVMACLCERLTDPPEVALVDLAAGDMRVLTELNPEFRHLRISKVRKLDWTNKYEDVAYGHLVEPVDYQAGRRYPLVVTTYRSGGFLRGAVGDEYPIYLLAARGFFVLSLDRPRSYFPLPWLLSDDTKPRFETALRNWDGPTASLDSIIERLDQDGLIDRDRVGLCGLSNGAEITCYSISHTNTFAAAVASSGSGRDPLDHEFMMSYAPTRDMMRGLDIGLDMNDPENRRKWQALSPALNAERVRASLLIHVADTEFLVGLQMYNRLKLHGKPVEMIVFPGERHLKMQPRHRHVIYERNVDWFRYWLQDYVDPDPAKREQYVRWRGLREGSRNGATGHQPREEKAHASTTVH
jgi:dipeptidyl aminopeptidase/acylaminoacyl peptidase